jgi:hypothetical protein
VKFKWCTKPAWVPHGSGPARGLDIIYVDIPSGKVAEKSSSYILSTFLLGLIPKVPPLLQLRPEILV